MCHGIAGRVAGVVPALERSQAMATSSEAARLVAMATLCRAEVGTLCACLS
ncbi:Uncharacterised protein [Mycobacterium tuberculosis]|uniref:Uncharacterized protein n=1 Tax=Mycobacterium tuberculosis TaxID=1773 RepID=A0A916LC18_MYCTX|nr:Uncharacterised protein [Mycobacterium tuberculosis]